MKMKDISINIPLNNLFPKVKVAAVCAPTSQLD